MTAEPEFNAHMRCGWCNSVRPKSELIRCDTTPICRDNPNCKEKYYEKTRPRPRRFSCCDDGHC